MLIKFNNSPAIALHLITQYISIKRLSFIMFTISLILIGVDKLKQVTWFDVAINTNEIIFIAQENSLKVKAQLTGQCKLNARSRQLINHI